MHCWLLMRGPVFYRCCFHISIATAKNKMPRLANRTERAGNPYWWHLLWHIQSRLARWYPPAVNRDDRSCLFSSVSIALIRTRHSSKNCWSTRTTHLFYSYLRTAYYYSLLYARCQTNAQSWGQYYMFQRLGGAPCGYGIRDYWVYIQIDQRSITTPRL